MEYKRDMITELRSPSDIYQQIDDQLSKIVKSLTSPSADPDLEKAQDQTREQLENLQSDLQKQLSDLKKNAEWDTFTIAFYGETGAGKSTLIETLRIILQEPTKRANQEKFRQLKNEYEINEESLEKLQGEIKSANENIDEFENKLKVITQHYGELRHAILENIDKADTKFAIDKHNISVALKEKEKAAVDLQEKINLLKANVTEYKSTANLWQKLINLFTTTPDEKCLEEEQEKLPQLTIELYSSRNSLDNLQLQEKEAKHSLNEQLSEVEAEDKDAKDVLFNQQQHIEKDMQALQQKEKKLKEQLNEQIRNMSQYADGKIIGDGRADYTRQTQRYDFTFGGNKFSLLDVPGIEGKEGLVLSEIEKAVQTAHAVFYVTNKAAPPQTGEDERKGTLEKIKQHLGSQTEVWSVFNKKITNPKHTLKNRPLISVDENESLTALEEKMLEQLGDHYQKVISLTALPAFLASTDHLEPDSQNAKRRRKFLQDFTEKELLEQSRMQAFLDMLGGQLLPDSKNKINRANFNKAKEVLDGTTGSLDMMEKTFSVFAESISENRNNFQSQLESSFKALQKRLDSRGERLIQQFSRDVRENMYEFIEDDIKNDSFKRLLEKTIEKELIKINKKLPEAIELEVEKFELEAADILERFEEQTRDLTDVCEKLAEKKIDQSFQLNINIDNGVNKVALVSALIGAALAPFTGGASLWFAGAAALTAIVSVGKAVASFFSASYKMSQQRKATDENLRNLAGKLRENLNDSLKEALPDMKKTIKQLEKAIDAPVNQAEERVKLLYNSNKKLKTLSNQIKVLGNL